VTKPGRSFPAKVSQWLCQYFFETEIRKLYASPICASVLRRFWRARQCPGEVPLSDRPYVRFYFLIVPMGRAFGTVMSARTKGRQELADRLLMAESFLADSWIFPYGFRLTDSGLP